MKQWVNWYQGDLKPKTLTLDLTRAITIVAGAVGLVLVAWVVLAMTAGSDQQKLQQLQLKNQQLSEQLAALQSRLEQRQPSSQLQQTREQLQASIAGNRALLTELQSARPEYDDAPLQLLKELAQITPKTLWLTEFSMSREGAMKLQGLTTDSSQLAIWVNRFQPLPLLGQRAFAIVDLQRNEAGQQRFVLRTQKDDATKPVPKEGSQ